MKKLFYIIPLLLAFSACSSEEEIQEFENNSSSTEKFESKYYFALDVTMPEEKTTRAETETSGNGSTEGEVAASDNEMKLKTAEMYLVDDDYNVLASFTTAGTTDYNTDITDGTEDKLHTVYVEVKASELMAILKQKKNVSIIMVGNFSDGSTTNSGIASAGFTTSSNISDLKAKTFSTTLGTAPLASFATNVGNIMPLVSTKAVPMQAFNALTSLVTETPDDNAILTAIRGLFTANTTYAGSNEDILDAKNKNNLYTYVLNIDLERAVARVDYKDRSSSARGSLGEFQYQIGKTGNMSDFIIELDHINVYNLPQTSYLFRHTIVGTSSAATTQEVTLFGDERGTVSTAYNWVMSPTWEYNSDKYGISASASYQNPLLSSGKYQSSWSSGSVSVATMKLNTNYYKVDPTDYTPCCYIPENTIPQTALMTTTNLEKYATGVAFTFRLRNKLNTDFLKASDGADKYPSGVSVSTTTTGALTLTMPNGEWIDVTPTNSTDGYYELTYYGFLNHNNGSTTSSGSEITNAEGLSAMHFAVVRNNAYQCMISRIENLPDPQNPKQLYLQLEVTVKPWVKRSNEFIF